MRRESRKLQRVRLFLVILLLFLELEQLGCLDNGESVDPEMHLIVGSWKWNHSGNLDSRLDWFPGAGTTVKDVYSLNGLFTRFLNDTLIVAARYEITNDSIPFAASGSVLMIRYYDLKLSQSSEGQLQYPSILPTASTEFVFSTNSLLIWDFTNWRRDYFTRLE